MLVNFRKRASIAVSVFIKSQTRLPVYFITLYSTKMYECKWTLLTFNSISAEQKPSGYLIFREDDVTYAKLRQRAWVPVLDNIITLEMW